MRNIEILCFIDFNKIEDYLKFLKNKIFINDNENEFIIYFEKVWMKKYKKLFNYHDLLEEVYKLKNLYKNKNGNKSSETQLISKLKSLDMVYLTNNICESIHAKISKFLPKGPVTKLAFRETINSIINDYSYKIHKCIRRDYITRTLIVLVEKYDLNKNPKFLEFDTLKYEIENTISILTGNINIDIIEEIFNGLDIINLDDDSDNLENNNINDSFQLEEFISNEEENNQDFDLSDISQLDLIEDTNFNFSFFSDDIDELDNKSIALENEILLDNISNSSDKVINLDKIKKERDFLNIFTIEAHEYNQKLRKILLPEPDNDLESIEDKLLSINLDKNTKAKRNKNTKNKKK